MAVAGRKDDDDGQPWYNRTPTVVGASIAALVVGGILIVAAMTVARQFGEPEQAPIDFVEPTYSATASQSGTATTQTITSTSPPETTDINPSSTSGTSGSSESSGSSTTPSSSESSPAPTTARTEEPEEVTPTRTSRQRPRTNVTRTFNPYG